MATDKVNMHPLPPSTIDALCRLGEEMSKMQGETPELRRVVTDLADKVMKLIQCVVENTGAVREMVLCSKNHCDKMEAAVAALDKNTARAGS